MSEVIEKKIVQLYENLEIKNEELKLLLELGNDKIKVFTNENQELSDVIREKDKFIAILENALLNFCEHDIETAFQYRWKMTEFIGLGFDEDYVRELYDRLKTVEADNEDTV